VTRVLSLANRPKSKPAPLPWGKSPPPPPLVLHSHPDKEEIFSGCSEYWPYTHTANWLMDEARQCHCRFSEAFPAPIHNFPRLKAILKIFPETLGKTSLPIQEFLSGSTSSRHVAMQYRFHNSRVSQRVKVVRQVARNCHQALITPTLRGSHFDQWQED